MVNSWSKRIYRKVKVGRKGVPAFRISHGVAKAEQRGGSSELRRPTEWLISSTLQKNVREDGRTARHISS